MAAKLTYNEEQHGVRFEELIASLSVLHALIPDCEIEMNNKTITVGNLFIEWELTDPDNGISFKEFVFNFFD